MDFISGEMIVVDKPLGWTSFDAVKRLRGAIQRRLNMKRFKVGHAGTLDPLATGVLIICTGRATRRITELQEGMKEYVAEITFGATTPSYDLEKEIDATYPWEHITLEGIEAVLPRFIGHVMQVPPVFSAVKIDGKRAYNYARKGKEVEIKAKPLEIREMEILDWLCRKDKSVVRYDPSIEVLHYQYVSSKQEYRSIVKRSKFVIDCLLDSLTAAEELILESEAEA